jgi:hypothetical protein
VTTSGLSVFNLDLNDIIEEAYERCGVEVRTGYEHRTARRSLNLLTIEWANRGINLWTIEQGQIVMNQGQIVYNIPVDTIDLLDQVVRTQTGVEQTDINISRISVSTYATIPNKNAQGRPIQVWVNRQSGETNLTSITLSGNITSTDTTITLSSTANLAGAGFIKIDNETIGYSNISGNQLQYCVRGANNTTAAAHTSGASIAVVNLPSINVWPCPDQDNFYTFVYWRLRRIQDSGSGTATEDIPFRMLTCLIAGLAYYLSMKIPEAANRIEMLKASYEEQWALASSEDREKAPLRLAPREMFY